MELRQAARRAALAIASLMVLAPQGAFAMSVSPTHIELKSAGSKSRSSVVVRNTSSTPLPVEAVLKQLVVGRNGKAQGGSLSNDFLVFPPQALIRPGASQVFRVTWVGEPVLNRSRSFLLTLQQLPVRMQRAPNQVQVVMAFGVVINVAPPRGRPRLKLVSSGLTRNRVGQLNPVVTVYNPSSVHALLPHSTIRLRGKGWAKTLSPSYLDQQVGIGLVQPGKRRRFVLPVIVPARAGKLRASLNFSPQ